MQIERGVQILANVICIYFAVMFTKKGMNPLLPQQEVK